MSEDQDQGDSPTKYYVQELDRGAEGLNWAIYERRPHGSSMIALCYSEKMAQRIMGLLEDTERDQGSVDDTTGAI